MIFFTSNFLSTVGQDQVTHRNISTFSFSCCRNAIHKPTKASFSVTPNCIRHKLIMTRERKWKFLKHHLKWEELWNEKIIANVKWIIDDSGKFTQKVSSLFSKMLTWDQTSLKWFKITNYWDFGCQRNMLQRWNYLSLS